MTATPGASQAAPAFAPPDFAPRPPRVALPSLSCDCHAHILGSASRHACSPHRTYTPPDCLLVEHPAIPGALGVKRVGWAGSTGPTSDRERCEWLDVVGVVN